MSPSIRRNPAAARRATPAAVFAALGDKTRLELIAKLSEGEPRSISELTQGSRLSRQAITKHLRTLEKARLVRGIRKGRESLFEFTPEPILDARTYLEQVSSQWDQTLARSRAFVES